MTAIDLKAWGKETFADLRARIEPMLKPLAGDANEIRARLARIEADTQATLEALSKCTIPERAAALRVDLETFLPERRTFVLTAVEAKLGTAGKAFFDVALEVAIKAAVILAKALIPIPGV